MMLSEEQAQPDNHPIFIHMEIPRPDGKVVWQCTFAGHKTVGFSDPPKKCMLCREAAMEEEVKPKPSTVTTVRVRHTIEGMGALAKKRNGQCLSEVYLGVSKKHEWLCDKGHKWWAVPNSIQQGSWCPECAGVRKRTIEDMHALAKKRGGQCLSKEYEGTIAPLEWLCSKGHKWRAVPKSIRRGTWCPQCARVHKKSK